MARLKDWPSRFHALMRAARREPFAWGAHDCCIRSADSVQACTGVDPAAKWRGTYSDAAGAARLMEQLGGLRAIGAMAGPPVAPARATTGDIGLAELADREVLVVHGGQVWVAVGKDGVDVCPADKVLLAWRVGGS